MNAQTSEAFYKSVFDNVPNGLAYCQIIFDENGHPNDFVYLKTNQNFDQSIGVKELIGKKATETIPTINVSNPELLTICSLVAQTGKPKSFETYLKPLDKWFFISVYSSEKNFFVMMLQNITAQKQVEKNLEDARVASQNVLEDLGAEKAKAELAEAKEKAALAAIGDGLFSTDQDGKLVFVNQTAEKLLNIRSKEVLGKSFSEVIAIEDEPGVPVPLAQHPMNLALSTQATTTTTVTNSTYYYVRKNKTRFPVAITVTPIVLEGRVIGAIEIFRDITLEKEVDQAKTEFVSLASHQLRTPLSTISWYLEMLLAGDADELNQKQKQYLDEAWRGSRHLVELVNALLNVSRLEMGVFSIETEPCNVALLVKSGIDQQKVQIDDKKMQIVPLIAENIPPILIDAKLFDIILQNILTNAVRYTPEKGIIKVSLQLAKGGETVNHQKISEDSIALTVSDTGCGIPENQQDKIFTKFFRADNVRQKGGEGTGLGLYIAKSIIDHAGGTIGFASKEGEGTTFYITLPLTGMKKKQGTKALK